MSAEIDPGKKENENVGGIYGESGVFYPDDTLPASAKVSEHIESSDGHPETNGPDEHQQQ